MSNLNRDLTVLLHMKEYCEQIEKTFDMFGKKNIVRKYGILLMILN